MGPAGVDANHLAARHRVPSICGMEACISGRIEANLSANAKHNLSAL